MSKEKINPGEICTVCQNQTEPGTELCECGAWRKRWLDPKEMLAWNVGLAVSMLIGIFFARTQPLLTAVFALTPLLLHFLRLRSTEYSWRKKR